MSNKTCGVRCKEHDMPCHVAYLPEGMSKNVGGLLRITDASVSHNHSHMIPTKDGSLLAHSWGKNGSRYFHAPKGTKNMKEITKKEAEKLEEGEITELECEFCHIETPDDELVEIETAGEDWLICKDCQKKLEGEQ